MNIRNCAKMTTSLKYVREISGVRYGLKTSIMTRLSNENIAQAKD